MSLHDNNDADSFFENFDQNMVIKSLLKCHFNDQSKQVCKSLESMFTKCNVLANKSSIPIYLY